MEHDGIDRPFSKVVEELLEALDTSYRGLERFFGGQPVKSSWARWARGDDEPTPTSAKAMADRLGCTVPQLLGYQPWPPGFLDELRERAAAEKASKRPNGRDPDPQVLAAAEEMVRIADEDVVAARRRAARARAVVKSLTGLSDRKAG